MAKLGIFIANDCEEIEALTVVDVLRRGKMEIDTISITGEPKATGSHGITFLTDTTIEQANLADYDGVILPGGMPGTTNLAAHPRVVSTITDFAAQGKLVAAICAAPSVLGMNGILKGKKAISYPGFEDQLLGAEITLQPVVVDHNIITSRGMGTAIDFALAIYSYYHDENAARNLADKFIYDM